MLMRVKRRTADEILAEFAYYHHPRSFRFKGESGINEGRDSESLNMVKGANKCFRLKCTVVSLFDFAYIFFLITKATFLSQRSLL